MASKKKPAATGKRKTHLGFRRLMSGVATVCIVLVFVGGFVADASVVEITWRAFVVWFGIFVAQWVLLKTYMAYEITRGPTRGASSASDHSR